MRGPGADAAAVADLGRDPQAVPALLGAQLGGLGGHQGVEQPGEVLFREGGEPGRERPLGAFLPGAHDRVQQPFAGAEVVLHGGRVALSGQSDDVLGERGLDTPGGEEFLRRPDQPLAGLVARRRPCHVPNINTGHY